LGILDDDVDINNAWESIGENTKDSVTKNLRVYDLKEHKPWFHEECTKLLYQRKEATLQWFLNPSQKWGQSEQCTT